MEAKPSLRCEFEEMKSERERERDEEEEELRKGVPVIYIAGIAGIQVTDFTGSQSCGTGY